MGLFPACVIFRDYVHFIHNTSWKERLTWDPALKWSVSGACGRMGREIVKAVTDADGMEVVGAVDVVLGGEDIGVVAGISPLGVKVDSDLPSVLKRTGADVLNSISP